MQINVDINPSCIDHFKSQLMLFEASESEIKILYDGGGFQDRHFLMSELVKRSFQDYPSSRTIQFWIFTGDNRPTNSINGMPLFSISGPRTKFDFIIPDPHILAWPQIGVNNYVDYCQKINLASRKPPVKMSAVWRGSIEQHPIRKFIVEVCNQFKDDMLDIKHSNPSIDDPSFLTMQELQQWAILIDMPGRGFSGRLKYFLHSQRPVIVFDRLEWDAITLMLEPGVHFVTNSADYNILKYSTNKIISMYDDYCKRSIETSEFVSSLTTQKNISKLLVKKVSSF